MAVAQFPEHPSPLAHDGLALSLASDQMEEDFVVTGIGSQAGGRLSEVHPPREKVLLKQVF